MSKCRRERVEHRLLAEEEDADRDHAADQPADEPLDHERPADEPVGRADQAHHLDLAAAGVDREPDRVPHQKQRGDQEQHGDQAQDPLDAVARPW